MENMGNTKTHRMKGVHKLKIPFPAKNRQYSIGMQGNEQQNHFVQGGTYLYNGTNRVTKNQHIGFLCKRNDSEACNYITAAKSNASTAKGYYAANGCNKFWEADFVLKEKQSLVIGINLLTVFLMIEIVM